MLKTILKKVLLILSHAVMQKLDVARRKFRPSRAKCCTTLNERDIFSTRLFLRLRYLNKDSYEMKL